MGRNWNKYLLYLAGSLLAAAYDDLSFQKIATQSPTYPGSSRMYGADNAVDGDISTCMRTEAIGRNSPYKYMWWTVDLGGVYTIYSVNILFKNYDGHEQRQRQRFAGFSLYISNDFDTMDISSWCYIDGYQLPPLNFTTTCITFGRYVTFYNERLDGIAYFEGYYVTGTEYTELCEVIVYGCETSGVYGSKCDIPCPMNCKNNLCDIQNGTCFGCKPGWTGTYCNTRCSDGWFGIDCNQRCSTHCKHQLSCNHFTGQCDEGCDAGWVRPNCNTACDDGFYGYECANNCSGNCKNGMYCNKENGQCDLGCIPGFTNMFCEDKCDDGWYGMDCIQQCPNQCRDNSTCNHVTGTCDEGCSAGWKGSSCDTECEDGTYGVDCAVICSDHCLNESSCNKETGQCERGCDPGYINSLCLDQCKDGWYGLECIQQCSDHCRANGTCNHVTGKCDDGCFAGWNGSTCDTACEDGTFGIDCANNCSRHCLNDSSCNKETGHCERGCDPGYKNSFCEDKCVLGYFGTNCLNTCSPHCLNNILCDHVNGSCTDGCKTGYQGDGSCTQGLYGDNCSRNCFQNCKTCHHINGACTSCNAGWMGTNCSIACMWSYGEDCQFPCSRRCINQTCDRFNGTCYLQCEIQNDGNVCDEEDVIEDQSTNWIIGLSISLIFNFIVLIGVGLFLRRKRVHRSIYYCTTNEGTVIPHNEDSTFYELPISVVDHTYQA